jgi:hypothetical protein
LKKDALMPENRCPTCSAQQTFQYPTQGLERRRFPKGRWVCEHELQPWHLRLETAQRDLAICGSEVVKNALLFEIARLEQEIPKEWAKETQEVFLDNRSAQATGKLTPTGQTQGSAPTRNVSGGRELLYLAAPLNLG